MSKNFKEQVTRIQETLKILYNCKSTVNLTIEPGMGLTKVENGKLPDGSTIDTNRVTLVKYYTK